MAINDVYTPPVPWQNRQIVRKVDLDTQLGSNILYLFTNSGRRFVVKPPVGGIVSPLNTYQDLTTAFTVDLPAPAMAYVRSVGWGFRNGIVPDSTTDWTAGIDVTTTLTKQPYSDAVTNRLYNGRDNAVTTPTGPLIANQYFDLIFNAGTWQVQMQYRGNPGGTDVTNRNRNTTLHQDTWVMLEFQYLSADRFTGPSPVTG